MKIATPTKTTADTTQSFTQMLAKAESEIARLAAQENQIALQLRTDQAELQALEAQSVAHDTQKRIAQDSINARRSALREAEAHAELSEGTLGERPDLKALERLLKQAQTEQMTILDKVGKAEQAQERRRLALTESIDRHYQTLATLSERRGTMEATRERVFAEQGEAEFIQVQTKLNTLREQRDRQTAALTQLDEKIEAEERMAVQSLECWPDQQATFQAQLVHHDHLTHILDNAVSFIETVLVEGRGAEIPWEVSQRLHMQFMGLSELLSIDPTYLRSAFRTESTASTDFLEERKAQIQNVLQAYRETKA